MIYFGRSINARNFILNTKTIENLFVSAIIACAIIASLVVQLSPKSAHAGDKVFKFGIVPQQSAAKLAQIWTPIMRYLSKETGKKIIFKTAPSIPEFEKRLAAGIYDIAYMNPYHYTVFHKDPGYKAIAKQRNKYIEGIIVVKQNSSIKTLADLNGVQMAFPAPAAFAASVLPRAALAVNSVDVTPVYVSSHDSVYMTVSRGIYDAGGGIDRTYNVVEEDVKDSLRVLWRSPQYTPHAFAVSPDMSLENMGKIQNALISMSETTNGKSLLTSLNFRGIDRAENEDWDDVRSLGIDLLSSLIKNQ
jgi:phosphonate transport system substrate-binding protein